MKKRIFSVVLALALVVGLIGTAVAATIQVNTAENLTVTVDGGKVNLVNVNGTPVTPVYVDGTVYLPIRAVAQAMGYNVDWNGDRTAVELTTKTSSFTLPQAVDKSTQPRIIITTDLEVDDMNGIMLSLMYASDYDLAGIVWTAGQFHFTGDGVHTLEEITPNYRCEAGTAGGQVEYAGQLMEYRPVDPTFLTRMIDVFYRADYEYLSQNNPNYPTPDYLLSIAKVGNIEFEGDYRYETEGSELIYNCIMDDDMRPLYIQHWGGINTTIRALYSIYEDYHGTERWDEVLAKVVAKVRIDGSGEDNCRADSKIDEMFPGLQDSDWTGFGEVGDYFQAIKLGEGPVVDFGIFQIELGTNETLNPYYQAEWLTDAFKFGHGQVMAQFHLMNDGQVIYGEELPYQYGMQTYIDWDEQARLGYGATDSSPFTRTDYDTYDWMCCQFGCNSYVDLGLRQGVTNSDDRYVVALFEDLAARADWAILPASQCNHAPVVSVSADMTAKPGQTVTLTATAVDPDGDAMSYEWWVPANAWTYAAAAEDASLSVSSAGTLTTQFTIPADAVAGDRFVVNFQARDEAGRPMTRYAQVIIQVVG